MTRQFIEILAVQNQEAKPIVSVAVIVITMVVPSVILAVICWSFWRASRRDRAESG